ncbi:hypothetical protein BJ166DRAFT_514697 [Pestalotiopsis sp. NC0098]|nr:hypothetical protein BJ166DRAFT_514697 [Pestalotiopsis sp. NC0098]
MVPAAGRINEKGEVIDDDGNAIGRVTKGSAKDFVDFVVTQEGDILDSNGGVVGKAEPLEDVASRLEDHYTTEQRDHVDNVTGTAQQAAGDAAGDETPSAGGGLGGALGGVGNLAKGATGGIGKTAKGLTGAVGDTTKGVTDTVGGATGTQDLTDKVGDTVKGTTDTVGDTTEGATGAVGDTTKGVTDTADEATKPVTDTVDDATGGATGKVGETVGGVADTAGETVEGAGDKVGETTEGATDTVGEGLEGVKDTAEGATGTVGEGVEGVKDTAEEGVEGAKDTTAEGVEGAEGKLDETTEGAKGAADEAGETVEGAKPELDEDGKPIELVDEAKPKLDEDGNPIEGAVDEAGEAVDEAKPKLDEDGNPIEDAEGALDEAKPKLDEDGNPIEGAVDEAGEAVDEAKQKLDKDGNPIESAEVVLGEDGKPKLDEEGNPIPIDAVEGANGAVDENGNPIETAEVVLDEEGKPKLDEDGNPIPVEAVEAALDEDGNPIEDLKAPIEIPEFAPTVAGKVIAMFEGPFTVAEDGQVTDQNGKILGNLAEDTDLQNLIGKDIKGIDEHGNLLGDNETILGKVNLVPEGTIVERIKDEIPEAAERLDAIEEAKNQLPDISILEGLNINKAGNVVDKEGNVMGRVVEGEIAKLIGKQPDNKGQVWDGRGNIIGQVEVVPDAIQNQSSPFEDFPDAVVDKNGVVVFEGRQVGVVIDGDIEKLIGKKVDADGDILDKNGNVIGKAERKEYEEPVAEPEPEPEQTDYSMLKDKKINKFGNAVDDKGQVWGRVIQGVLKNLIGKKVGDNGEIFNDAGKVIGKVEPVPDEEREDYKEPSPFEDFPGAVVADEGKVMFNEEQVGIVVDGDAKKLKGKPVDADGDILDKNGNLLGRAERWEKPEEEPEPEVDNSSLAGKRINKAGNAVDSHGDIYGRVIEGDLKRLIGKMCDKQGFIRNEGGDVIGKAELIPEAEREGLKEGPFADLPGCTVNKEGHVVTPGGDVVGRLTSGDAKILFGRAVDDDGDILDKNGNVLGHAERWEPEEVAKDINPMSGRKVNREGNVVDENGDIVGKLTSGDLSVCAGKKIDDDGDVIDQKGSILGHVSLLEDIPEPEPEEEESEEDKQKRLQLEQDKKIAQQICVCIEHSLDKIRPICKMITENIDRAERTPEDERDEEELVKVVKPLIEEGGKILTEANGVIRGLDPDGRISANAKHKTASREATPEEYHLADLLKELTGTVTETIENAKRKLEDMKYAKKELNPLWGLLAEPLFQIIAAVGLLLSGVLGLVGKLLNGLGLGGLVNNLLGGLGLTKVLDGLGLGSIVGAVTGQDDKKKNKGKSGGSKFLGII